MSAPTIVWFRQDLRLDDNPALRRAIERGGPVIPVYIWSPGEEGDWPPGGASRWWLHQSLEALAASIEKKGGRLILRSGNAATVLRKLVIESGAEAVHWNRRYEPASIARDAKIKKALESDGVQARSFNGGLLWEPWDVLKSDGEPYKVFTPYWKACQRVGAAEPEAAPSKMPGIPQSIASEQLASLGLEPKIDWAGGIRKAWTPGEAGARKELKRFLGEFAADYGTLRNRPDMRGTSRMSPYLHFGEIGPRRIWRETLDAGPEGQGEKAYRRGAWTYLREIAWREFGHNLLYHFPSTPVAPLRQEFTKYPWNDDADALRRWRRGETGYPIVDAGMRELWTTGWMHNRVRMIVASFLIKDLRIHWIEGARWFWDTLVDADLANNTLGWQWTAGCGADAAPYFRIFNPVSQGEKFDPKGDYVRRWVPELAKVSEKWLPKPWEAPEQELAQAGVRLGRDYPEPIVDHAEARKRALAAYEQVRRS
jgi:deoxyribodipyrimidine photo-lyase